jgi:hypothetical protein
MSDDSFGFEPIDDELRRRLDAAGPHPGDPDATLGALRPRYRRAKRRHQLVLAAGAAGVIGVIIGAGAAVVSTGGPDPQSVRIPAANSSTSTTASVPRPVDSTPAPPIAGPSGGDTGPTALTSPSGPNGAATTTSAAPAAPVTNTYSSAGGTVTVKLENGALSIVSTQAAAGYSEERHDVGPDRVEVRFTNSDGEWRIRVDLANGTMVPEITQH